MGEDKEVQIIYKYIYMHIFQLSISPMNLHFTHFEPSTVHK